MKSEPKIYDKHDFYNHIADYKDPEGEWLTCPVCGLRPRVWQFDNGKSTACGCWNNTYDHFSIHAESIGSYFSKHKTDMSGYDHDALRKNWNHWVKTGEIIFEHAGKRTGGRW